MFKNIFVSFLVLVFSLFFQNIHASSIKVEDVFSDINSDYKYLKELQELYDRGMVKPDNNGNFNPKELLSRDDFVGITMESTCSQCIQPGVDSYLINNYSTKEVFFDIDKYNKNFYCIAEAEDKSFVVGYEPGSICEDGTYRDGESPFCPNNTIILEEAIAIVLRTAGIMTKNEAESYYPKIASGEITEVLSEDVSPKNIDGSIYTFYPYFLRALEYEVLDVDTDGNTEIYNLVEVIDGKIRPKQALSKEDFLKIAYITIKASSCNNYSLDNNLSAMINIYDEICSETNSNCSLSDLDSNNDTYDFGSQVETKCEGGIEDIDGYIWNFYNESNGNSIIKYGSYIDDFTFLDNGVWTVYLNVIDNCGNKAEVYNTITIDSENSYDSFNSSINADPISGTGPLSVDFEAIVSGGDGKYSYIWDFGDGNTGIGKNVENVFEIVGVYEVKLIVTDDNGNVSVSTILIEVIEGLGEIGDTDLDGIYDDKDLCVLIPGVLENNGCPILEKSCTNDSNCGDGYYCSESNVCLANSIQDSCEYNGGSAIFGNAICNSCPCSFSFDFNSLLRTCDVIFPAITSPDSSSIYSRGSLFQIK